MNKLQVGMDKTQVKKIMGKPHAISVEGDVEFLAYNLLNKRMGAMREYTVKLVGGKVETYGPRSDFAPVLFPLVAVVTNTPPTLATVPPASTGGH